MSESNAQTRRRRRRRQSFESKLAVLTVSAAAGVGAGLVQARPTGLVAWDTLLSFALAASLVFAAARARPEFVTVLAVVACLASGITVWAVVAIVALVLAVVALGYSTDRLVQAVSAALAIQALLRLPEYGFFGLSAIIAAIPVLLVLVDGYRRSPSRVRLRVRVALAVMLTLAFVVGLVGGLALLQARNDVARGIGAVQRGLTAVRVGEPSQVAAELDVAERALSSADRNASSGRARLLQLLPVVSQHQRTLAAATSSGAVIAREAAGAAQEADLGDIQLIAGSVDLGAIERMAPRLFAAETALRAGSEAIDGARSGWLLPSIDRRVGQFVDEINAVLPDAELAASAAEVVPSLLGSDRLRTYFVLLGAPAEAREFGGFVGSWAVIDAAGGKLTLRDAARISRLYDATAQTVVTPDGLPPWYLEMARPSQFPQNVTSSPQAAVVADVGRQLFGPSFDDSIDGFIYLDPWALISLLELTGPVDVDFQDAPLSIDNAEQFFFRDQYSFGSGERTELFDGLASAADAVLDALVGRVLPGPEELGRVLGPAARGGHIQLVTFDESANAFLEDVHLLRPFGRVATDRDFMAVVHTNGAPNKLDLFLERDLRFDVTRTGSNVSATATVTLTSTIPDNIPDDVWFYASGAERTGVNRVLLSIYSPHPLATARIDGQPVNVRTAIEFGLNRYLVEAIVDPDGVPVVVEFDLEGTIPAELPYALDVWHQPLVNRDSVNVRYSGADGSIDWSGVLVENITIGLDSIARPAE